MQVIHKGHKITVTRQEFSGDYVLNYDIVRERDGFECDSGSTHPTDPVDALMTILKDKVDHELAEADPWSETAQACRCGDSCCCKD